MGVAKTPHTQSQQHAPSKCGAIHCVADCGWRSLSRPVIQLSRRSKRKTIVQYNMIMRNLD